MSLSVFVCGTYSDLSSERGAVLDALQRLQVASRSMEFFGARPQRPIEVCLEEVRGNDILVAIVGGRYGTLVADLGISYSEAEYREAFRLSIPSLIYFLATSPECEEPGTQKAVLLDNWKTTLMERHTCLQFDNANKLAVQVAVDVGREIRRMEQETSPAQAHIPTGTHGATSDRIENPSLRFRAISSQRFGDDCRQLLTGLAIYPEGDIVICGDFGVALILGLRN